MAFRFNFGGIEDGDSGEGEGQESGKRGGGESKDGISREGGNPAIEADECSPLVKAEFVHPIENETQQFNEIKIASELFYSVQFDRKKLTDSEGNGKLKKILEKSDLEPRVYEGGFKVWECALDLIEFLSHLKGKQTIKRRKIDGTSPSSSHKFVGKRILDLGCGHGLPGIFSAKVGASHVAFQDLNREVLHHVTIPNVLKNNIQIHRNQSRSSPQNRPNQAQHTPTLPTPQNHPKASVNPNSQNHLNRTGVSSQKRPNTASSEPSSDSFAGVRPSDKIRVSFVAGDWSDPNLYDILGKGNWDYILSSDTLYSTQSIPFLVKAIDQLLAKEGECYVAAKRYYFGIGGGILTLLQEVSRYRDLKVEVVRVFDDGKSNLRDIAVISRSVVVEEKKS
ncbi:hypothetical protein AAMO2058_000618900 [Amorphochlora amoebiformis]